MWLDALTIALALWFLLLAIVFALTVLQLDRDSLSPRWALLGALHRAWARVLTVCPLRCRNARVE